MRQPRFPRESKSQYPLSRRLGGSLNRKRRFGEEQNPLILPATEQRFFGRPIRIVGLNMGPNVMCGKTAW